MDSLFQEYSNENTTELSLQDDGAGLTERAVAKAWKMEAGLNSLYNTKSTKSNKVLSLIERALIQKSGSSTAAYEMCDFRHLKFWKWNRYLF